MHGPHMHFDSDEESTVGFYDKAMMSRLIKFLAPHKYKFVLALVLMLIAATYNMVTPFLQKIAIDDYIMPPDAPGNLMGLTIIALIFIGISFLNMFVSFGRSYTLVWMGQNVIYDISVKLFAHLFLPRDMAQRSPIC